MVENQHMSVVPLADGSLLISVNGAVAIVNTEDAQWLATKITEAIFENLNENKQEIKP